MHTHAHPCICTRMCTTHIHNCTRNLPKVIGIGQLQQITLEKHAMHTWLRHLNLKHIYLCAFISPPLMERLSPPCPSPPPSNDDFQMLSKSFSWVEVWWLEGLHCFHKLHPWDITFPTSSGFFKWGECMGTCVAICVQNQPGLSKFCFKAFSVLLPHLSLPGLSKGFNLVFMALTFHLLTYNFTRFYNSDNNWDLH